MRPPHASSRRSFGGAALDASLRGLEVSRDPNLSSVEFDDEGRMVVSKPSKKAGIIGSPLNAASVFDDEDLRHRPAYLAIKKIQSKVSSRRAKNDPAMAHYTYDRRTLQQAKAMFDAIDVDQSGEVR